ncbi:MAG: succinate dehydrogenase assembly factor 2 [Magnetococcales bacterium]|nr:succinate dehydrogenase assembly factor 2 [Magnetococcales bacterium]
MPDGPLSPKQKAFMFRALRRSMAEVERIMQRFVSSELASLDDDTCDRLLVLLDHSDADLLDWLTGVKPPPASVNREDLERLRCFKREVKS